MLEIIWTDDFSVGVSLFDEQHKQLVNMLNKLISHPEATTDSETISDLLTDMTQYAHEHFKAEEKLMQQYDFPDYGSHKNRHREFLKQVVTFCNATYLGSEKVPRQVLEFLTNWWSTHILEEDMAYKDFFISKGVA